MADISIVIEHFQLGTQLIKQGRHEEAQAEFDLILSVKPNDFLSWYKRSVALVGLDRYDEAIFSINKAIKFFYEATEPSEDMSRFGNGFYVAKRNLYLRELIPQDCFQELMAIEDDAELIAWLTAAIDGDRKPFNSDSKLMSFLASKGKDTLEVVLSVLGR